MAATRVLEQRPVREGIDEAVVGGEGGDLVVEAGQPRLQGGPLALHLDRIGLLEDLRRPAPSLRHLTAGVGLRVVLRRVGDLLDLGDILLDGVELALSGKRGGAHK